MPADNRYAADIEAILSHRHDQGGDLWTTPDRRLVKGSPFSALECALYLLELGVPASEPVLCDVVELIFAGWQPDGRFRLYPDGAIYPCHTAGAAMALCRLGHSGDERLRKTFRHLLDTQEADGGWRCNKFSFGRGPETEHANPHPTLVALDAMRFDDAMRGSEAAARAAEFLLWHWTERRPVGPCHYGIGTLFMQVEYPFRGYNLFYYLYVLSFYRCARDDPRFREALSALEAKLRGGQVVVERVVPKLAKLAFCRKGQPSELATRRYQEALRNIGQPQTAAPINGERGTGGV